MKFIALTALLGLAACEKATTTRYWDCSGGSCGCNFLSNGRETACHSSAMFKAPAGNKHGATFYGGAAISKALGGGGAKAKGCGQCFKVTGSANVKGGNNKKTTLVLKAVDYCPPANS